MLIRRILQRRGQGTIVGSGGVATDMSCPLLQNMFSYMTCSSSFDLHQMNTALAASRPTPLHPIIRDGGNTREGATPPTAPLASVECRDGLT